MKKRRIGLFFVWLTAVLFLYAGAYLAVRINGQHLTLEMHFSEAHDVEDFEIRFSEPYVECIGKEIDSETLRLKLHSLAPGKTVIEAELPDGEMQMEILYVHSDGVIAVDEYLGWSNCGSAFLFAGAASVLLTLILLLFYYRSCKRDCLYQYKNAGLLGLILFLSVSLLMELIIVGRRMGLGDSLNSLVSMGENFSWLMLPVAFIISIFVTISNLVLMKHEGVTWRNMLGALLGTVFCLSTFLPGIIEYILEQGSFSELHRANSGLRYTMKYITDALLSCIAYLECILIGMIVMSGKAARHVPAFDKDYILILGCQVGQDGKPTKLLQSRIDRAVEFARMQEEKTGRKLIFVPSGGKGDDEVISEAECMKNYLCEIGIPENRILIENRSVSTEQNIRFSHALIAQQNPDAKIAFSTTNYHVFRAGALTYREGYKMEGIGAKTKAYFWLNAFVREFIAVLYERKRQHITLLAYILTAIALVDVMLFHAAQI